MGKWKSLGNGKWESVPVKPVEITIEGKPVVIKEEVKKVKEVKVNLDLNRDGVVDTKDASIAGKVMSEVKKSKYSKKKKY